LMQSWVYIVIGVVIFIGLILFLNKYFNGGVNRYYPNLND
jgi:hypothetical protein